MARILGGNPQGEFRGKLGGIVYSRNRSGQIARSYARGIDRNSESQVRARTAFAQAITAFHSLSPLQKVGWQEYGSQYFTSVNKGNLAGVHSGVNAFASLRNTLLNMAELGLNVPGIVVNGTPATAITLGHINFVNDAPIYPMSGKLAGYGISAGIINSYDVSSNSLTAILRLIPEGILPGSTTTPASTASVLEDTHNNKVGFLVKISGSNAQRNVQVNAPDALILASTGLIASYVTPLVLSSEIIITMTPSANVDSSKYKPSALSTVFASLWMYNSRGEQIKLGANWLEIGA